MKTSPILAIYIKYSALIRRIEYFSKSITSRVAEGITYYTHNKKGYTSRIYP